MNAETGSYTIGEFIPWVPCPETKRRQQMLIEITRFMRKHNIVDSIFGQEAINDLVLRMRRGAEILPVTRAKIIAYMADLDTRYPAGRPKQPRQNAALCDCIPGHRTEYRSGACIDCGITEREFFESGNRPCTRSETWKT